MTPLSAQQEQIATLPRLVSAVLKALLCPMVSSPPPLRFSWLALVLVCAFFWALPNSTHAQSGRRSTTMQSDKNPLGSGYRIYVEPKQADASPYLPQTNRVARYPLALHGFSAIDLRNHQQWVAGSDEHQAVFDGQLYRFADSRQRAIFAAAPQRYAPVLGSDCIVTFADTGDRIVGDLHFGLQHKGRLFFFAGPEQRDQFRSDPTRFVDADIAHQGNCIVSKIDRQQLIQGLPETVATVGGLRYFFLGAQQQSQFLINLRRYGAEIAVVPASEDLPKQQKVAMPNLLVPGSESGQPNLRDKKMASNDSSPKNQEMADKVADLPTNLRPALSGYCPVSIRDNGTWEEGNTRHQAMYDGKLYQFAGAAEKNLFTKEPTTYIPAFAGDCMISFVNSNFRVPGSIFHTAGYEGRLFMFAGAAERLAFKDDPTLYVDIDLAMEGNCAVTHLEKHETVAGLPEHMTWHQSKRYYFATQEMKEKFLLEPERYTNPLLNKKQPVADEQNPASREPAENAAQ